jgi:hypothetical protein
VQSWHSNTGMSVRGGLVDYKQDGPRPCTAPLVCASQRVDGVIDIRTQRGAGVFVLLLMLLLLDLVYEGGLIPCLSMLRTCVL